MPVQWLWWVISFGLGCGDIDVALFFWQVWEKAGDGALEVLQVKVSARTPRCSQILYPLNISRFLQRSNQYLLHPVAF